ncbi:MAG: hypothetical protein MJ192_08510 [Clostridia bacterium]|nr:hypothetical protein [Clostridia bacterium]
MNTAAKRLLTSILTAALLLCPVLSLASCADNGESNESNTVTDVESEAQSENPEETLDVPELNFNGFVFSVLGAKDDDFYNALDVDMDNTADAVNNAIYTRNRIIEDRFGIRFAVTNVPFNEVYAVLNKQVRSGYVEGDNYELLQLCQREAYNAAISGLTYNVNKLEYIDTGKVYYFRSINEQCCFGDYPFFAYGADSINLLAWCCSLVYNKKIASDLRMEDLYETVRSQQWTHDKLFTLAENAAADLNGDGSIKSADDRMGLVGVLNRTVSTLWQCSGEFLIVKDEDGMPKYNAIGNDRLVNIMTEALARMDAPGFEVFEPYDHIDVFMENHSLFYSPLVGQLNTIRTMQEDYGLLPFPKYDTNQTDYISRSGEGFIHVVPSNCGQTERVSAIMQALAYYSYGTVYDAYYEQALTTKFLRDPDSVEMLKLILSTLTVDIGDSIWFNDLSTPILSTISSQRSKTGLGSLYKRYDRAADKLIQNAVKFIEQQQ